MKLIKQSHEIWEQGHSLEGIYKQIERAGRICYKSEDKIKNGSAQEFVDRLVAAKHYAMLEHGTVYLKYAFDRADDGIKSPLLLHYFDNPYSILTVEREPIDLEDAYYLNDVAHYVTTNYRVIIENGWEDDLKYLCVPTEHHAKRVTVHLTTSRGIAMELLRHRVMSFAMESTRYCNYSKDKFGGELTFILPGWTNLEEGEYSWMDAEAWEYVKHPDRFALKDFLTCEYTYQKLIDRGWQSQQAAVVLPNALKAELVVTGFVDDWKHLFDLRVKGTTGAPHPQMKALMEPVYNEFVKLFRK